MAKKHAIHNRKFSQKTEAMLKSSEIEGDNPVFFNSRQRLMLNKLIDGFTGKLNTSKWAKIAKCSQDSALRDIKDLLDKGILTQDPHGGRSTGYELYILPYLYEQPL
jgi:Fic family protein